MTGDWTEGERGQPWVGVLYRTMETLAFATYAQKMGTGQATPAELERIISDAKARMENATVHLKRFQGWAFTEATIKGATQAAQVTLAQETADQQG